MQTSQQHVGSKGASQQYLGSKGASQQYAGFTTDMRASQQHAGSRQRPNDVNFSVRQTACHTVHAGFKAAYEFHDKHTLIDYFPE